MLCWGDELAGSVEDAGPNPVGDEDVGPNFVRKRELQCGLLNTPFTLWLEITRTKRMMI